MNENEYKIKSLAKNTVLGKMSRRSFMHVAGAMGLLAMAPGYLSEAYASTPIKGGHIKIALQGGAATDSLDPATFASNVPIIAGRHWMENLVMESPTDGSAQPVLAESWEAMDGAKKWVFKIRKGVLFHNGKEMTNKDVVASLMRHSDEKSKSGALGIMRTISSIKADGDDYVVVNLDSGSADLPLLLSDYHLAIQPNGGFDKPDAGIGTGPYKVEVAEHGTRYLFVKNKDYRNDSIGHADSSEILVINDSTARIAAIQSGRVHMANRVDPKTVDLLKRNKNLEIKNVSGRGHYVFNMFCNTEPFTNNDLRMALKYAMDREAIVNKVLRGYGTVGNDFPINAAYSFFPDSIEQRSYDMDKAKYHYKKSGHSGKILLRISDVAFSGAEPTAILFQDSAKKCGIDIEIKREPSDGYWSNVWNKMPFHASYWGGRATQDQMYTTAYYSKADWNDTRFKNDKFDKWLVEARAELNASKRKAIYTEMGQMVRDEGGTIVPMFNDFVDVVSSKIDGFVLDPAQEMSNSFAGVRCWLKA